MTQKVLLVDDEPALLRAIERHLGEAFDLTLAEGPMQGLQALTRDRFAVVVSDMRMPVMDGVQFLTKVREIAPNTVRMMLTGNADQMTAVKAVNEGSVFRFVNKPADPDALRQAIESCMEQHRLIEAEKELLEKTLGGSVRVLMEILATVNPDLFGRAQTLKNRASQLGTEIDAPAIWEVEIAAMLCQIGAVALPPGLTHKERTSSRLPEFEAGLIRRLPLIGSSLISKIPRLESVALAILYQDQHYDGSGIPGDGLSGDDLPLISRILKVAKDFGALSDEGKADEVVLRTMRGRFGWYDPKILAAASRIFTGKAEPTELRPSTVGELVPGDILAIDLVSKDGILLMSAGQTLTGASCARIASYVECGTVSPTDRMQVQRRLPHAA